MEGVSGSQASQVEALKRLFQPNQVKLSARSDEHVFSPYLFQMFFGSASNMGSLSVLQALLAEMFSILVKIFMRLKRYKKQVTASKQLSSQTILQGACRVHSKRFV